MKKTVSGQRQRPSIRKGTFPRLVRMLFRYYPVLLPVVLFCLILSAVIGTIPSIFMQNVISVIENHTEIGDWQAVGGQILRLVAILGVFYVLALVSTTVYSQIGAVVTQGTLQKLRSEMFTDMQKLPVKYFDTHNHGDIMSYYTNDIDTLRQLISQSLPQLLVSGVTVVSLVCIMMYYCVWLGLVVIFGALVMTFLTGKIGGNSSRYFFRQQQAVGKTEGFIEEMMNGQKVIKVFCHEEATKADFDRVNGELFENAVRANQFANILGPILNNVGNILYVIVAVTGGALYLAGATNVCLSPVFFGSAVTISVVVPFINMTKQFAGNINQVSHQVNSVVMGLAGASRIFSLIDEVPEVDEGYVTLVNARQAPDGTLSECPEHTGVWAWKHPHADGSVTYTRLAGDVRFSEVDFAYEEGKPVLRDVTIYAEPGQKVAFVGATGAGKTTVTNLINRFYDIADGKIRYDGININKIKKADLRRSLGIVLQDVNLFTGTVMENIRYGKLDATDEECMAAARLAGADGFITRLPDGYNTLLSGNGAGLSQGQRQLLSIARAAVADPPVMILDEATSSIDTRTESIVQRGMDALMHGRTVFVIAHRLSTVKNADVIMVLDRGRIIERGNHASLLEKRGRYYQLYTGAFELE